MKPAEYNKELKTINAGLQAAQRVIEARAQQLKSECPGIPINSIVAEVRRGNFNDSFAAIEVINEWERLAVQEKANA